MQNIFDREKLSKEEIDLIKEKYGYKKEDESYHTIRACSIGSSSVLFHIICVIDSFKYLREGDDTTILRKAEYERIWNEIDKEALTSAVNIIHPTIQKSETILSLEHLKEYMDNHNLTETYLKEKNRNDKIRAIKEDTLTSVKFNFYTSGGEGLTYIVLKERVDPVIFNKLKRAGLYYAEGYVYPFKPNWAMGYNEKNILKLKEQGIKIN